MERKTDAKTILIVEDNVGLNILLTEKVKKWGYQTVSVNTGMEAMNWLNTNTPYLIIMDYSLSDMNGHELLANLKSANKPIPPFIVTTGQGDELIAVDLMKLGAMDYLVKNRYFLDKLPEVLKRIDKEIGNENKRFWAEKALIESEANLAEAQRISKTGSWKWDLVSNKVTWSKEMFRVFDINPNNYNGQPEEILKVIHPEDLESFIRSMNVNLQNGDSPSLEYRIVHTDGSVHYIMAEGRMDYNELGKPIKSVGTARDITEQKLAQLELIQSEKKYREMADALPVGVFEIDMNGTITFVNQTVIKWLEYSADDFKKNTNFINFVVDGDSNRAMKRLQRILTEKIALSSEYTLKRKSGVTFPVIVSAAPIIKNDKITGARGTVLDITERKRAENERETLLARVTNSLEEPAKAKNILNEMMERVSDGFVAFDKNFNCNYVNTFGAKHLNRKPEELIGKNYWMEYPEVKDTPFAKAYLQAFETQEPIFFEDYFVHWDRWFSNRIYPSKEGITIFFSDISELKKTEEALHENQRQLKSLFENAADAIFIADIETGTLLDANYAAEHLLKKPLNEIIGLNQSTLHPYIGSDSKNAFLRHKEELKKSDPLTPIESEVICSDGTTIPVEILASQIFYKEKDCLMGTFRNISERKKAENIIREQAEQMSVILATTPDGFFRLNKQGIIVEATKKMSQLTGYTPTELTNLPLSTIEANETANEIVLHMKSLMERGYGIFESCYTTKFGEKVDVEISTSYWPEKNHFLVFARDISERKRAEMELIKTKQQLQKAQAMAKVGNWELDLKIKLLTASNEALRIYGIKSSNLTILLDETQRLILPEYRTLILEGLKNLVEHNIPFDTVLQINKADTGELRTIHSMGELELDSDGKPKKVIGVIQDVTEQKEMENELRILSNAIEQNPTSIVITNTQGTIEYVNPKFTQLTGYTLAEVLGKNPRVLKTGITTPEEYSNLWETIASGKIWQGEFCNKKKDGTQFWESALISPVFSTFNKITHYVAVKEDITEKKETERKIMSAVFEGEERERNRFSRELHDGLGPLLSSIKLYFQWIAKTENPEKKLFLSGKGNHNINEAILTLREISNNLSPQSLNTFGLILAIQNYVEGLNQMNNIQINLQSNIEKRFNKNVEIALYRITLELINNCLKHAEAKDISISLQHIEFDQLIRLTYHDNGKGFDIESQLPKTKGRGLLNIQYRVNSLNGKIKMKSSPGKGLEVTIEVPLVIEN
ncbi:MAG: PAS domain S-box protein [Salinivirgaceae bacterium]